MRYKLKNRLAWAKRTLTGYTVMFADLEKTHTVVHKPFRQPVMKTESVKKGLKGKKIEAVFFDEWGEYELEDLANIEVKNVQG